MTEVKFESIYSETYQEHYGFYRPVISKVVKKFFVCGDLEYINGRFSCSL